MADRIWKNPVIKGACDSRACGGACCKIRTYTDQHTYTESWCPHFNQDTLKCNIYETRPEGCRRYPDVLSLTAFDPYSGCGYYIAEADEFNPRSQE